MDWPAECDYEGPFRYDLMINDDGEGDDDDDEGDGGLIQEMLRVLAGRG